MRTCIIDKPIPIEKLEQSLSDPACGGIVTFIGRVRNHHEGKKVTSLTYEAYAPMAEKIFDQITHEAIDKFGVKEVHIIHRIGDLKIGDAAVWVGAQSAHRGEAFRACEYAIDELKKRAPIWKKEHYEDAASEWVACHHPSNSDMVSLRRGETVEPSNHRTAVILAGGKSSRFGSDKLFVKINGKTLIETLIETLKQCSFDIIISGPKDKFGLLGFPVIEDENPYEGPLAALGNIWKKTNTDRILLIAGDMPFLSPQVINKLWEKSIDTDITLLTLEGEPTPIPAVYSRRTEPLIQTLLAQGRKDLKALMQTGLKVKCIPPPADKSHAISEPSFININTIEDLEQISHCQNNIVNLDDVLS